MSDTYWPILAMFAFGVIFAVGALAASWLLGEKGRRNPVKDGPYECGMPIQSQAHSRFSVKFYIVAMLFILFDIEVVFMAPWAVAFGDTTTKGRTLDTGGTHLLWEAFFFVVVLVLGLVYVIKKGVLEWQKAD